MRNPRHESGWLSVAMLALVTGCGGATFSEGDAGGAQDTGTADAPRGADGGRSDTGTGTDAGGVDSSPPGDAGSDVGHHADSGPKVGCPVTQPAAGESCTDDSLSCEYGDDPMLSCDAVMMCKGGSWSLEQAGPPGSCSTHNDITCPAAYNDRAQGSACLVMADCYYPQARCSCDVQCFDLCAVEIDGGPNMKTWNCDVPTSPTNCPIPRPRVGSPCDSSGQNCDYGGCQGNVALTCQGGVWQEAFLPCPG